MAYVDILRYCQSVDKSADSADYAVIITIFTRYATRVDIDYHCCRLLPAYCRHATLIRCFTPLPLLLMSRRHAIFSPLFFAFMPIGFFSMAMPLR